MKTVFRIKRATLLTFNSYIYDATGVTALHSTTTISVSGDYVTGAISIDLVTGKVRQLWLTGSAYQFASGTYSFGTWAFRQRSASPYMLYFGQDDVNSAYTAYSKEYLALAPHIEPYLHTLIQGNKAPLLVGSYSMLENSGYTIPDFTGNLGTAYLGSSTASTYSATHAPAMTAAGIRFTQASQYIQLPQPPMSSYSNQLVSLSFSVSFGINLNERSGYIFSRVSATSQDLIKLIVNSDGTLKATMNGITLVTSQTPLIVGTWYQVTVFFMFSSNRGAASISLSGTVDTPNNDINPLTSVGSYSEASSDKFTISGFKGILRNFNIYSPGSPRLTDTTCTTSCLLDIGVTQAACIIPACPSNYYVAGTTCALCDPSCLTCSATGNNACLSCEPYKVLNHGVCETPAKIPAYIQRVTQYIINIASLVVGLLRFNTPGPIWFGCLSEILRYVRYLDLINSARLQAILDEPDPEWLSIDYISSAPDEAEEKFETYIPPVNFEKYGLSSSFLLNFWTSNIFLAEIVVVLLLAAIFAYITSQFKSIHAVFEKIKEALRWNYLLDVFTSFYSDIALFSALEFSAPQFDFFLEIFSFILCIITNIVVVTILVRIIVILNKLASKRAEVKKSGQHRHLAALQNQLKKFEVIFGDFKDDSIFKQGYMVYFLVRLYLFYAIVGYLYLFPVVQAALINCIGVVTVAYLCLFRPFKDKWTLIGFIIEETIIEIVNVCVLIVATLDNMGVDDVGDSRRVVAGDIIIVCNFIFLAVGLLYLFVQLLIGIRDIYRFFRKGANKKKIGLDIRSRTMDRSIDRSIDVLENSINDTSLVMNKSQSQTRQNLNPNNTSMNGIFNLENNDSPRKKRRLPQHGIDNQVSFGNNRKQYTENGPFQHGNLDKINSQLPKSIKVNPGPERNPDPHRRYFNRMISLYAPTSYKTDTDYYSSQKKTHDKKSKKNKRTEENSRKL